MNDVIIQNPNLMESLQDFINSTELCVLQQHLKFAVLCTYAPYQTSTIVNLNFDFYEKQLDGQKKLDDLWKRALSRCETFLGDEVGKLYVARHFPLIKQQQCQEMIDLLIKSLRETLQNIDWMSDVTKTVALLKLDTFVPKVGVPSKYHSIEGLWPDGLNNDMTVIFKQWSQWDWKYMECNKLYEKVDKEL
uniref:Peptidase M13 N-terminal domain-containing protein n=1 Tax=viral metagenome TaxID=1070528 RepID=A0A6C0J6G5_9ZZZZ